MAPSIRIPILTYHSMNVGGNAYESNDHVALESDLALLSSRSIRVCPLAELVHALLENDLGALGPCVAITFDDGGNFDFYDLPHPTWGTQRGMYTILEAAAATRPRSPIEATSFVVVSPSARIELDRTCMIGKGWWSDEWWCLAEESGHLRIESHSWDHNHECLASTACHAPHGTFELDNDADAQSEIEAANTYLCERRGRPGPTLFAYPYGRSTAFLAQEYFPRGQDIHGVMAAFTTDGSPVEPGTDRWRIPRFVCGWHWKDVGGLERILDSCFSPGLVATYSRTGS